MHHLKGLPGEDACWPVKVLNRRFCQSAYFTSRYGCSVNIHETDACVCFEFQLLVALPLQFTICQRRAGKGWPDHDVIHTSATNAGPVHHVTDNNH